MQYISKIKILFYASTFFSVIFILSIIATSEAAYQRLTEGFCMTIMTRATQNDCLVYSQANGGKNNDVLPVTLGGKPRGCYVDTSDQQYYFNNAAYTSAGLCSSSFECICKYRESEFLIDFLIFI